MKSIYIILSMLLIACLPGFAAIVQSPSIPQVTSPAKDTSPTATSTEDNQALTPAPIDDEEDNGSGDDADTMDMSDPSHDDDPEQERTKASPAKPS